MRPGRSLAPAFELRINLCRLSIIRLAFTARFPPNLNSRTNPLDHRHKAKRGGGDLHALAGPGPSLIAPTYTIPYRPYSSISLLINMKHIYTYVKKLLKSPPPPPDRMIYLINIEDQPPLHTTHYVLYVYSYHMLDITKSSTHSSACTRIHTFGTCYANVLRSSIISDSECVSDSCIRND